jgi:hypothetical protein
MGSDGMATKVSALIGQSLWFKGKYDGETHCQQRNCREAVQPVQPRPHIVLHDVKGYAGSTDIPNPEDAPMLDKAFVMLSVTPYVREHDEAYLMFPLNVNATVTAYIDCFDTTHHSN